MTMDLFELRKKEISASTLVTRLALACNFKLMINDLNLTPDRPEEQVMHPKAVDLKTWLVNNVNQGSFDKWYIQVRKTTSYFPGLKEAEEALEKLKDNIRYEDLCKVKSLKAIDHKQVIHSKETIERLWEPVRLVRRFPKHVESIVSHYFVDGYPKVLKGLKVPVWKLGGNN